MLRTSRKTTGYISLLLVVLVASMFGSLIAQAADADIVITEIMNNPSGVSDTLGEWLEIHNTGTEMIDLNGWTLMDDGTDSHVIVGSVEIAADAYVILARDSATMVGQGIAVAYEYEGFILGNSADEVVLLNAASTEIDRIVYDDGVLFPDPNGASMKWDESTADNSVGANWSESTDVFGTLGDKGTPGLPNGEATLQGPAIYNVYHRALLPIPGEDVTVYADVVDDGTVDLVLLYTQINGSGFIGSPMTLVEGDTYSTVLSGGSDGDQIDYYVVATDNEAQSSTSPADAPTSFYGYAVAPETITPIASVHADSAGYDGTMITIEAQVYVPGNYKADPNAISAYVQDSSGRGLNIYGTTRSTGIELLNDTTNILKITGRVDYFSATVELVNYEVELVSTGNAALTPATMSTLAAAALTNEGTYVATSGPITTILETGGSNPAFNFTINDGTGDVVIRVDEDIVDMTLWAVGDQLDAAGAGGSYQEAGQIIVGLASDLTYTTGSTPPVLVSANLDTATEVMVQFDEPVDPATAGTAGNYSVYNTAIPALTIDVISAVVQSDDTKVLLTIATSASGISHTLSVSNVEDLNGNAIVADSTIEITEIAPPPALVINEIMNNPSDLYDSFGEWFEVYNADDVSVDMNGWVIKDAGTDATYIVGTGPLVINPGEYKVFAVSDSTMTLQGVDVFYEYSGVTLGNGTDELYLYDGFDRLVDAVVWDDGATFPDPNGASMQWDGTGSNDDGANWYENGPTFGLGDPADLGTPGAVNMQVTAVEQPGVLTELRGNHPNPFNPTTSFNFTLKKDDHVSLRVYDLRGQLVRTVVEDNLKAGSYDGTYQWDGKDNGGRTATSGTYFYRLETGSGYVQSNKMTLLK